ncbi:MAG: hypothetical protein EBU27_01435 [Opitutae bacterium]|nr:hypothetical protein [Opitutae bacterium]
MSEKRKWWIPLVNRAIDFVFTSFCPICDGQVFKDGYSYVCQECLDTLAWVRGTRCKLCGIPMSGMDFQGLTCASCLCRSAQGTWLSTNKHCHTRAWIIQTKNGLF